MKKCPCCGKPLQNPKTDFLCERHTQIAVDKAKSLGKLALSVAAAGFVVVMNVKGQKNDTK